MQAEFAQRFSVLPATLRQWEQGARRPTKPARVLLQLIADAPACPARVLLRPIERDPDACAGRSSKGF